MARKIKTPPGGGSRGGARKKDRADEHQQHQPTPCIGCAQVEVRPRLHRKLSDLLTPTSDQCLVVTDYGSDIAFLVTKVEKP